MYVIMRNNIPIEIHKGPQDEATNRMNQLHAEYCERMNVRATAVYYHCHLVPVHGEDDG